MICYCGTTGSTKGAYMKCIVVNWLEQNNVQVTLLKIYPDLFLKGCLDNWISMTRDNFNSAVFNASVYFHSKKIIAAKWQSCFHDEDAQLIEISEFCRVL